MPVASQIDIRAKGNIPDAIMSDLIDAQIDHASHILKETLGSELYTSISAPSSPYTADDLEKLKNSETYYALSLLIPLITHDINNRGAVKSGGLGDTTWDFMGRGEAERLSGSYRSRAESYIAGYIVKKTDHLDIGGAGLWAV